MKEGPLGMHTYLEELQTSAYRRETLPHMAGGIDRVSPPLG